MSSSDCEAVSQKIKVRCFTEAQDRVRARSAFTSQACPDQPHGPGESAQSSSSGFPAFSVGHHHPPRGTQGQG